MASLSSSSRWNNFEVTCPRVSFSDRYTSCQRLHTTTILEEACRLLTYFIHRDVNILHFWSNVSEGAYNDLTSTMTDTEILSRLTRETAQTDPNRLAEMIAHLIIYIPHPDGNICKSHFDFDVQHASTYQEDDLSIKICLHPNIFDLNITETGETINNILPKNTSIFFCSILIAHELTHAVRLINNVQIDTPKLPFFASNAAGPASSSTIFDAGNVVERHLIGGEIGISWTPVPFLFLILRDGKSKILYQPIIDARVQTKSVSPILQFLASNPSIVGVVPLDLINLNGQKRHTFSPHRSALTHEGNDDVSCAAEIDRFHSPNMAMLTITRTR